MLKTLHLVEWTAHCMYLSGGDRKEACSPNIVINYANILYMLTFKHRVPRNDVRFGIVRAEKITVKRYPDGFDELLQTTLSRRARGLHDAEEVCRLAARDILRNGSYKPTGRGKPASEYLLRAATDPEYRFPRINSPVDICNYLSLDHVVPISLWDLDRAAADRYVFRLGAPGESYVFNKGGQRIDVKDLVVGCRVREGDGTGEEPIVNPVRDSQETKTTPATQRVAACIYAPSNAFSISNLSEMCRIFAELLAACGDDVDSTFGILSPQESLTI